MGCIYHSIKKINPGCLTSVIPSLLTEGQAAVIVHWLFVLPFGAHRQALSPLFR
jgi:hypothetical protein